MKQEINDKTAIELMRRMLLIRLTEETIAERYQEQKMRCPVHLSTGQEAVPAAVGLALGLEDQVVSTHRSHGHYIGKGGNLARMLAEIYGKSTGCSKGIGGSMHLVDRSVGFMGSTAIVGGTIPVGVGLALAHKQKRTGLVCCVYLGDGATEEGVFFESVNFAVLKKLPVLFICENNRYSVYSPLSVRQPEGREIYEMVKGLGCRSYSGDGNDVLGIYKKVRSAMVDVRDSAGPCFFEFHTYRWREHCGPDFDNHIGYRTEEEFQLWKENDPVARFESVLLKEGIINSKELNTLRLAIRKEVDHAFIYAEKSPFPSEDPAMYQLAT